MIRGKTLSCLLGKVKDLTLNAPVKSIVTFVAFLGTIEALIWSFFDRWKISIAVALLILMVTIAKRGFSNTAFVLSEGIFRQAAHLLFDRP